MLFFSSLFHISYVQRVRSPAAEVCATPYLNTAPHLFAVPLLYSFLLMSLVLPFSPVCFPSSVSLLIMLIYLYYICAACGCGPPPLVTVLFDFFLRAVT